MIAGAGGVIAQAITKSFWGRLVLGILCIIFLPFIIYIYVREYFAVRKSMQDLRTLARQNPIFNWLNLQQRAKDVYTRVQTAWNKNDVSEASEWMDDWYWQNQKYVHLDQWEENGLRNVVKIKHINTIKPLFVSNGNAQTGEGSQVVMSIEANIIDYLQKIDNGTIVEGDMEYKDVDTIWTFVYKNNKWVVQNIEPQAQWRTYVKMKNELDPIPASQASLSHFR